MDDHHNLRNHIARAMCNGAQTLTTCSPAESSPRSERCPGCSPNFGDIIGGGRIQ